MSALPKQKSGAAFVPTDASEPAVPRHGRRRQIASRPSVPLRWPTEARARRELFDAWHQIAMQVVHEEKQNFRLVALVERFINWQSGELWPTNETLARRAGGCGESTIKRDITAYQALGLIQVDLGLRRQKGGRLLTKRTIRLAVPVGFSGRIEDFDDGVNRGPAGESRRGVNRGPDDGVNRGTTTFEDTSESALEDSHAV